MKTSAGGFSAFQNYKPERVWCRNEIDKNCAVFHIFYVFYAYITLISQWARWRHKSPASRLFTQPFIQAQIKGNIKALRHWPLWGNSPVTGEFPTQRASNAEMFPSDDVIIVVCNMLCITVEDVYMTRVHFPHYRYFEWEGTCHWWIPGPKNSG